MKKIRLKGWVETTLEAVMFICFFLLGSDCDSLSAFIFTKLIFLGVIILNGCVLSKYGRLSDE